MVSKSNGVRPAPVLGGAGPNSYRALLVLLLEGFFGSTNLRPEEAPVALLPLPLPLLARPLRAPAAHRGRPATFGPGRPTGPAAPGGAPGGNGIANGIGGIPGGGGPILAGKGAEPGGPAKPPLT